MLGSFLLDVLHVVVATESVASKYRSPDYADFHAIVAKLAISPAWNSMLTFFRTRLDARFAIL